MNLDQGSNNTPEKRTIVPFIKKFWPIFAGVIVIGTIVLVMVLGHTNRDNKDNNDDAIISQSVTPSPTDSPKQLSEEEKQAVQAYKQYCEGYNQKVDEYNSAISRYNNLLEQLSTLDFLNFPEPYPEHEHIVAPDVPIAWDRDKLESQILDMEEVTLHVDEYYDQIILNTYNCLVDEYNIIAKAYEDATKVSSIEFISGLPKTIEKKDHIEVLNEDLKRGSYFARIAIETEAKSNEEAASYLAVVLQITNPSQDWVMSRLSLVNGILESQPVTSEKDPNQMLGKQGGYTSCVYFSYKEIQQDNVKGNDVVEKGTECGGAIEVYANKEDALNRCEYLSQFDDTLLYSGSYAIVGSMVIRTSYKLSNQQQIDLTNEIVRVFTDLQ